MQLYGRGIRRRLAPMLRNLPQIKLAYSLLFSLPGTPVMRYGDEIGMGDDLDLKEREAVRTPMQWSNDAQAGFSASKKTILPVIDHGPYAYKDVNVEAQLRSRDSLLLWTTNIIRLRKECPEIGWGDWELIKVDSPGILAIHYTWQGNNLVIIHNFNDKAHRIAFKLKGDKRGDRLVNLLSVEDCEADEKGFHRIAIEAFSYRWYRVGDMSYIIHRTETKVKVGE